MTVEQSAVFLSATILTMLGFVIAIVGVVIINNILHKYWKPVTIIKWDLPPAPRFAEPHELKDIK